MGTNIFCLRIVDLVGCSGVQNLQRHQFRSLLRSRYSPRLSHFAYSENERIFCTSCSRWARFWARLFEGSYSFVMLTPSFFNQSTPCSTDVILGICRAYLFSESLQNRLPCPETQPQTAPQPDSPPHPPPHRSRPPRSLGSWSSAGAAPGTWPGG